MDNTIENLEINVIFNDKLGDAAERIDELAQSIRNLNEAASKTSAMSKMISRVKNLEKAATGVVAATKSMDKGAFSMDKLRTSMAGAIVKAQVLMKSLKTLNKFAKGGAEDNHKLAVALRQTNILFGDGADEVVKYAQEVQNLMGIPMGDFLGTQANFANMFAGFGIGQKNTQIMSKGLTELSYDLAAVNTKGMDQAAILTMLESGMSGYDKSLRGLGFALRDVELQEILNRKGIDLKVAQLSRAAKAQLMYTTIMEQAVNMNTPGALAKQLNSPIMAMDRLKNQVKLLAQTLASVLLPVLMKSMTFLTAFAMAANKVIVQLAKFFGIEITPLDFSGGSAEALYNYADGLDDIGDGADETGKKIKALKEQMGGFDKLNVMKPDIPESDSKAGMTVLHDINLDMNIPGTDNFLGDMMADVEALSDRLKPLIATLGTLALVLGVIKVGGWFADVITGITGLIGPLGTLLKPLKDVFDLWMLWVSELGFFKGTADLVMGALAGISWPIVAIIALIIAIGFALKDLWDNNEEFRNKVIETWEGIKDTFMKLYNQVLEPIYTKVKDGLLWVWENVLKPLWALFVEAVGEIGMAVMELWNENLKPFVDMMIDIFGPFILLIVDGLVAGFKWSFALIGTVLSIAITNVKKNILLVIALFKGIIDFLVAVFTGDWQGAWDAIVETGTKIFSIFYDNIKVIIDKVVGFVMDGLGIVGDFFGGIGKMVGNLFGKKNTVSVETTQTNTQINKGGRLPAYASGTNYVNKDHIAKIHEGEAIIPKAFNDKKFFGGGNDDETKKLIKETNKLLMNILQKDSTVKVSSSDIESAGGGYRRMVVKSQGGT